MIRIFYDISRQGHRLIEGYLEHVGPDARFISQTDLFISDQWISKYEWLRSRLNSLLINLDLVDVPLEDHFNDTTVWIGKLSDQPIPEMPWDRVKFFDRTLQRVEFFTENPWVRITWFEGISDSAQFYYDLLARELETLDDRDLIQCIDGPCAGDYVLMNKHDDRVAVITRGTPGMFIYVRSGDLYFVREHTLIQ